MIRSKGRMQLFKKAAAALLSAALIATSVQYPAKGVSAAEGYGLTPAEAFAIGNGDFTNGTDMWTQFEAPWDWGAYDVAADWTITEDGTVVDIQNTGVFHYDWNDFDNAVSYPEWLIALNQENVELKAGYTYELSLGITSTIERTVKIGLESLDGTWYLWTQHVPLTVGENRIEGIKINAAEDFTGTFFIQMGHNENDEGNSYAQHQLTISDIRLEAEGAREAYVLVKDSDFTDTSAFTTSGNVTAAGGYLTAAVTDLGTAPDSTSVAYQNISVTAGETYLLQFAGRADNARLMQVQLGAQVVADAAALDTYTENYSYEFTAETTGTLPLTFMLGNTVGAQTGTVYLDNIGLWSKATDGAMNVSFFQPEISLAPVTLAAVNKDVCEGSAAAFTFSCNDNNAWAAAKKHLYINRTEADSSLLTMVNGQAVVSPDAFVGSGVYKVAIRAEGFECSNQVTVNILPGNGNIIQNGSFENGLSDWTFYSLNNSSSASLTGDFGLKISTIWWDQWSWDNNPPYNYVEWQTMLNQSVNLTAGKTYKVAFTAYSTTERPILVALKNMSGSGSYVNLSTTPATYEVTLTENWTEATELQFSMGYINTETGSVDEANPAHDIYISDIVMTESVNTPIVYYPVIGGIESGGIYREPVTPVVHLKDAAHTVSLYKEDGNGSYVQVAYTEGTEISEIGSYKFVAASAADASIKTTKTFTIRESGYNYDNTYFILTNRQNSLALTASGVVNGAAVIQTAYDEKNANHYFTMEYVSGNYFVLKNAASDLVVSVKDNSNDNAAKLVVTSFDDSDKYQQWSLMYVSQGYYSLINRGSGKAIDVPSASYDTGIQLQQYDSNSSNAQQWDIIQIDMQLAIEGEPIPDTSTNALWQQNSIIYPVEQNLEPAGPVNIQWYNTLENAASYILQIDDEAPVTVPATNDAVMSYEWYTVDVDTHTVAITGVLDDGTQVVSDVRTFYISKKGACWATLYRTEDMNISWYYNWGTRDSAGTDKSLEYTPMTWGNGADIEQTVNRIKNDGYSTLLGFNEPDGVEQSNVSAADALAAWKYLSATGLRLGSPCTAIPAPYTNGEWLQTSTSFTYNWFYDFMDGIEADDSLYIDFIAIHDYDGSGDPQGFIAMLEETHRLWPDYPIWVTEFGVAEWTEGLWNSTEENVEQVKYFMETVLEFMDNTDYIERYAWFPFDPNDAWGGASGIFNYDTGELNELGEQYAASGLPTEYYELVYGETPVDPDPVLPTNPSEEPTVPSEPESSSEESSSEESSSEESSTPPADPGKEIYLENVAKSAVVTASSEVQAAANTIDGDAGTRWESNAEDPQWICYDLGAVYDITQVSIDWETAAAQSYQIQVSEDGVNWTEVYAVTDGTSGASVDAVLDEAAAGRYVRIYGETRTTDYGYSIYEVEIQAEVTDSYYKNVNLALNKDAYTSAGDAAQAVDGNIDSRWESAFEDDQYIYVDLGRNYRLDQVNLIWEAAYASAYTIDVSADGTNWTTVYTESAGNGETDSILLSDVTGRYVRMQGVTRSTGYGYSLWELQVYGGIPASKGEPDVPSSEETSTETEEPSKPEVITPSKVTGVKAVYENGQIKVTWDNNGAAQYRVMRFTSENGYETVTYKAAAEGYVDTDLIEAQRYFYRICGYFYNADGQLVQGSVSDSVGVVATDKAPGKVAEVTASISNGSVTLDWDAPEGVRYYKIARAPGWTTADGNYTCIKYNVIDTAYTDTDVAAGKWRYKVVGYYKAVDGNWVYGTMSPTLFVTVE